MSTLTIYLKVFFHSSSPNSDCLSMGGMEESLSSTLSFLIMRIMCIQCSDFIFLTWWISRKSFRWKFITRKKRATKTFMDNKVAKRIVFFFDFILITNISSFFILSESFSDNSNFAKIKRKTKLHHRKTLKTVMTTMEVERFQVGLLVFGMEFLFFFRTVFHYFGDQ